MLLPTPPALALAALFLLSSCNAPDRQPKAPTVGSTIPPAVPAAKGSAMTTVPDPDNAASADPLAPALKPRPPAPVILPSPTQPPAEVDPVRRDVGNETPG